MPAYAESIGLPFLDVQDLPIDVRLPRLVPAVIARQHSCMPVHGRRQAAADGLAQSDRSDVEEQLRLRFGMPVRTVLCLPASVNELINKHYSREAIEAEKSAGRGPGGEVAGARHA